MIEETGVSGYECMEQISVTEASISHRRSEDVTDDSVNVTVTSSAKRRRFETEEDDEEDDLQLQYRFRREIDVNLNENVASTAVSGADHVNSSVVYSLNDDCHDSISDLKDECVSVTDIFISGNNNGFSTETSTSSVVCLESEEIESLSTFIHQKKMKKMKSPPETTTTTATEATSRLKPPPPAELMPSAAELEEFFSKAESYEQKRFIKKYNFDIVKDVPLEGRYQWLPLKP